MSTRSFINHTPSVFAGQHRLQPNRPLRISVPSQQPPRLSFIDLGSPFCGSTAFRASFFARNGSRRSSTSSSAPSTQEHTSASGFVDFDSDSSDEDYDEWEYENHAQYVTIPFDSPFYRDDALQTSSSHYSSFSQMSFACGAMDTDHSDIDRAAQTFHDELARMAPGLDKRKFDWDCLKSEMGSQLVEAPLRLFEDDFYGSLTGDTLGVQARILVPETVAESESDEDSDDDGELCSCFETDSEDDSEPTTPRPIRSGSDGRVRPLARSFSFRDLFGRKRG
ncbi:hypothetical protein V5O48_014303 [Marasmius crinis-equi]|uniref:Uncharacterized protein n=1 Tax=Marasmius crinis-equi TaxID=585013 RepID=A0ABR3EXP8_9AGAR